MHIFSNKNQNWNWRFFIFWSTVPLRWTSRCRYFRYTLISPNHCIKDAEIGPVQSMKIVFSFSQLIMFPLTFNVIYPKQSNDF